MGKREIYIVRKGFTIWTILKEVDRVWEIVVENKSKRTEEQERKKELKMDWKIKDGSERTA